MTFAETYIFPYLEHSWWEWALWYAIGHPAVKYGFAGFTATFAFADFVDRYLTAFHRKSGNRLMYDGEPEEWRWRWPKE